MHSKRLPLVGFVYNPVDKHRYQHGIPPESAGPDKLIESGIPIINNANKRG
ncbi:hypothetical protein [Paenibacillus validus]|uniref:hypothetical protein n=1 Tax=Paenibacillus validus TaxID=44253 RepID=UPI003D2694B4